ncbi:hypothetical protein PRIC1_011767 [Phytophthora ramorum]
MDNQQQRAAPTRLFSTRFLPTDSIPEYNALLDTNLGKRREFLLGNRHSLELMQQTGVIERVETQPDNPNQGSASASRLSTVGDFMDADEVGDNGIGAAKRTNAATLKGLSRNFSSNTVLATSCKPVLKSSAANRLALFGSTKLLESSGAAGAFKHRPVPETSSSHVSAEAHQRGRSAVPVSVAPALDELKTRGVFPKRSVTAASGGAAQSTVKGTVEHLLESDAAFMTQIRLMKEQLAELESTKAYLDTEIGRLRRKIRGVNAVRENDVAVAHCSSIMQHRLSKAEEEYMKLVTQQQEVKMDVDRVRRELLSLRKVRQKLQEDIEDVAQANQNYEEKIHASKTVRNQLSEELSELEQRAEVELETQRLNLPPEDAVIVDVSKLMGAVQERNSARRDATVGLTDTGSLSRSLVALNPGAATATTPSQGNGEKPSRGHYEQRGSNADFPKSLLDHCTAFRVLQNSLGFEDLTTFEQQFTATEEQLLSKYKANLTLADEVATLEKELSAVNTEKKSNRANVRGIMQASEKTERGMQTRIQTALSNIRSYNELREQRNREHAKLRGIMLRCLDALHIDGGSELSEANASSSSGGGNSNGKSGGSSTHSLYWTETPSPELLEMLQRKMTQVAVTLKVKHSSRMNDLPPEALRLNRGHDGRRSNMFSTREASKIVLGPREPSGSALAAILGTVQVPSVENAVALTENASMNEVLNGLHRAISPARRKASSLSLVPPEIGKLSVPRGSATSTGSAQSVLVALIEAGGGQARRSTPNASPSAHSLATRPSLAVMAEADTESEDEEDEDDKDAVDDEEDGSEDDDEGNDAGTI